MLELEPTVRGYLTDAALRTGVDALLEIAPDDLPPDLRLTELRDYIAARGAAETIKYDYVAMLEKLWSLTWGAALPDGWQPAAISDAIERSCVLAPEDCWDEEAMTLFHVRGDLHLYTAVSVEKTGVRLGFSLERSSGDLLIETDFERFVFTDDDDWGAWLLTPLSDLPTAEGFDLDALRSDAARALAFALMVADSQLA